MHKKKMPQIRLICMILMAMLSLSIAGSVTTTAHAVSDEEILTLLQGKTAGVMTGTPQDSIILSKLPDTKLQYFNSATDIALALEKKKIDFFALSTANYYTMVQQYKNMGYLDLVLVEYDIGTIFPKTDKGDALREQLNEYIAALKASGELEKKQDYWLYPHDWENVDIPENGENGILTLATTSTLKPFSFQLNGKPVGYEIDILAGFCKEYGYGLKIQGLDFSGLLIGITTGKYDFAAGQISWTEDRAKSVNFSDFYYTQKIVPIVNAEDFDTPALITADTDTDSAEGASSSSQSQSSLGTSIQRTLIDENRWMSLLQGLLVTLIITIAGFVLANLLGAAFCAMSMSKSTVLHILSEIYSKLMQGLPVVVVLMMLYYIVFGKSDISNVLVAILGFGIVFGAYMAQLFEGGIRSVDKGQSEAALATGLTKAQTFGGIVLPQAIRTMLPGYFSNLISLMKGTAVVGYIAVNDLTKVGDIIRSNTYEAIVPLLTIAIIYFVIAYILLSLMNLLRKRLMPKRMRNVAGKEKQKAGGEL